MNQFEIWDNSSSDDDCSSRVPPLHKRHYRQTDSTGEACPVVQSRPLSHLQARLWKYKSRWRLALFRTLLPLSLTVCACDIRFLYQLTCDLSTVPGVLEQIWDSCWSTPPDMIHLSLSTTFKINPLPIWSTASLKL